MHTRRAVKIEVRCTRLPLFYGISFAADNVNTLRPGSLIDSGDINRLLTYLFCSVLRGMHQVLVYNTGLSYDVIMYCSLYARLYMIGCVIQW